MVDFLKRILYKKKIILGKDGYDVLKNCKRIVDHENAMSLQYIASEFFSTKFLVSYKNFLIDLTKTHFWEGTQNIHEIKHEAYIEKWKKLISSIKKDDDGEFLSIKPSVEGRLRII